MHTGLEDARWDLPKLAAYFAERARGEVGLIVTGGYAPTKRGWLKPFAAEMTTRLQAMRHREVTEAVHDEGGAIALQVLHAGRYGYHPLSVERVGHEVPDHAVPALRPVHEGRRPHRHRVRALGRAGPQGGVRRGRDHGLGGLPDQPVPRGPHQRPHRPLGRLRGRADALPARDRAPVPRAGGRRLPDPLPHLAARPGRGRPELGRGRRPRARARGGRRDRAQHRHRLARGAGADDHHPGPARRLAGADRAAEGRGVRPGLRLQPDQHPRARRVDPRRRRGRPGLDGAAAAGRPGLRRQGRGRPRRRDQHLHRLQPGLPRPRLREPEGVLPGEPAGGPRDRAGAAAHPHVPTGRGRRRRTGRARGGGVGGGAGLRGHPLRAVRQRRRPVPARDGGPGQGGVRRDAALLHPSDGGARRRGAARVSEATRGRPHVVRRGRGRHRRRAAAAGARRDRPPERRDVRRGAERRRRARRPRGGRRRRRHRRRRLPLAHPRAGGPRRMDGALGRRRPLAAPGRPDRAQATLRPPAR